MARHRYCILILCFIACLAMATPRVCRGAESGPFSFDVLNTEKLTMRFTHQDGIHQNTTSLPLPVEVTSLCTQSAVIESQLVRERLTFKAELSQSALNDETTDIRMDSLDKAWRAQLFGKGGIFSWGLSTRHMGPAYMTFSNPLIGVSRSRYDFDSTIDLGPSAFSLSALKKRDYLDGNELNPVVETSSGTLRYTYARPGSPKLLTSYSCSDMEYAHALVSGATNINTSHTIFLGASFTRPKWSMEPTYIIKKTQESSNTDGDDIDTSVVKIAGELKPVERVSFSPQFSFSNTSRSETHVRSFTRQSALSGRVKLVSGALDLTTTLSHQNSRTDDGSLDTSSVLAGGRIDVSLDRFISTPMRKSASIRGQVKRIRDHVGETSYNEWEACAALSIVPRAGQLNSGRTRMTTYR